LPDVNLLRRTAERPKERTNLAPGDTHQTAGLLLAELHRREAGHQINVVGDRPIQNPRLTASPSLGDL
jgi:hypothetical protein